jgi:G3E family GTPase
MSSSVEPLRAIPTNIITGFLGVGKTSAILHLLESKPADERWAVLVNEFGEIGVDGSLFQGVHGEEQQVYIREVPGGCMCCAAGLPMQIALNQLLARAKPDRLLIEPTGLGHPLEVLQILTDEHYSDLLSIQKTLTLVDARKLEDARYTEHQTFNQQIAIADVVVGNKQDLYQSHHCELLKSYVNSSSGDDVEIFFTEQGRVPLGLLEGGTAATVGRSHHHHHGEPGVALDEMDFPEDGFIKAENQGEGFKSVGWRFEPAKVFDYNKLFAFLNGIVAERMKAVLITGEGVFGYNLISDALVEMELDDCMESRLEIIATEIDPQWQEGLFACLESLE